MVDSVLRGWFGGGMKATLLALFVALLMVGCGEQTQKEVAEGEVKEKAAQIEAENDPSVPLLIPCEACGKEVSKKTEKCLSCGHPATDSVVAYKKAKPFGGLKVLAKIKKAKESGAAALNLEARQISDLSPLTGLTKLEGLTLSRNQISNLSPLAGLTNLKSLELWGNEITDVSPLKELRNLKWLSLNLNEITDISPLAGLTKLEWLWLDGNQITDPSPLKRLTNLKWLYLQNNEITEAQKAMLKKALPKCDISF
jgi:hypothetical protein